MKKEQEKWQIHTLCLFLSTWECVSDRLYTCLSMQHHRGISQSWKREKGPITLSKYYICCKIPHRCRPAPIYDFLLLCFHLSSLISVSSQLINANIWIQLLLMELLYQCKFPIIPLAHAVTPRFFCQKTQRVKLCADLFHSVPQPRCVWRLLVAECEAQVSSEYIMKLVVQNIKLPLPYAWMCVCISISTNDRVDWC